MSSNQGLQWLAVYRAGQLDAVLASTHQLLQSGVRDAEVVFFAALSAAKLHRPAEFAEAIELAPGGDHDKALLGVRIFVWLMKERDYPAILEAQRATPPSNAAWPIAVYYAGCAAMMLGRHTEAMACFRQFREALPRFVSRIDFFGDGDLNVIFRQGRLVADAAEVARRMEGEPALPMLEWLGESPPRKSIVFASANHLYFNAMAEAFVAGMIPRLDDSALHIHVIHPDAASLELIRSLRNRHSDRLYFSLENEPRFATFTYFSCARFYIAGQILDRYRAPMLAFDFDIAPRSPVAPFLRAAEGCDFCCFKTKRDEPASLYQASIMYWADTEGARRFLDRLQRFCWPELANPSVTTWMLDQAALFSLLADPESDSRQRFGDFAELLGRELEDCVAAISDETTKAALRLEVRKNEPIKLNF